MKEREGFQGWLERKSRDTKALMNLVVMLVLTLCALVVFWPLGVGLAVAFMLTLRQCWKRDQEIGENGSN